MHDSAPLDESVVLSPEWLTHALGMWPTRRRSVSVSSAVASVQPSNAGVSGRCGP